ncbi:MAG: TldD/PmbA family protein [Clostridiales bacterium]|nr:TldD/PmbA family protein [Clostridiales bacterium]
MHLLNDLKAEYLSGISSYTELRAQVNTMYGVSIVSGNLVDNSRSQTSGVNARVYKNGVYGFSSMGEYSDESVKAVIDAAQRNALFMDRRVNKGKPPLWDTAPADFTEKRDFVEIPQKILIDYAKELDEYINGKYPDLASRSVMIRCDSIERLLRVSNGSRSHSISPRSCIYVSMTTEASDGSAIELFDIMDCGKGYFSDLFTEPKELYEKADELYTRLMAKRDGVFSDAGICDCIIDSSIAGMIAHEAVGHTVEADLVMAGSVAASKLGCRVASEKVSITDFAHTAFGKEAPLPVYVDDEGVVCEDAPLIKDGILVGYMNNRDSAVNFNMKPQGNARAFSFSDEPLIRMRNTAIHPGTDKLSDMIASIDKGYYLTKTMNGQADTTGEFMFGITMGYEIKNGKLGKAIRDTTISGVAFDMLKTVDMLSDEVAWSSSGYCGKKQPMPVSDGGPAVKCKVNIGGR